MGEIRRLRCKLTYYAAQLIIAASDLGYECALDFVKRCDDCKVGKKFSLHKEGLAFDLHLYKDGKYLDKTEDHKKLGDLWKSWGFAWGGEFNDGNHYSIPYDGRR